MVYARDSGETVQLTGSTLFTLTITDINDNKPVFTQSQYVLEFREGFNGRIDFPGVRKTEFVPV